jgi:class 3 adenylate cyclase/tetratricopeptide (TPR) repeat protein
MMQCLSCAYENPEAQKFCGNCGVPLNPAAAAERLPLPASYTPPHLAQRILTLRSALEGERKLVTVMFCDIANSTQLAARVGAEAMHALLNRFFELALAAVHRYEGTINQFLGDGFMALFGAPVAHEDHARRALLAALGIQQRLQDPAGEAVALREVRVRVGINTGMVVVGKIGDNLRMDYTAIGNTTNLAARLQSLAAPGTIRLSEATHRAALPYFEFTALGKHTLKGIAEPVEVYDVRTVRSAVDGDYHTAPTGISSPLVGRDRELSLLSASLETLRQGRGGVVILQGEPGMGKSRLIAEARRQSGSEGVLWLEGRALSFGRRLSYWPFIEILKRCFGIADTDAEAQAWSKLEQAAHELFEARAPEIVPYVATVLALEMTGEYKQRVQYLDAQALGRQVFLSMRQLFERLIQRQPIVLVMEDWHWVDHSSVALCEHLLPLTSSGLLFWFVTRSEPGDPAARIRAAASRHPGMPIQEIALVPLAEAHSSALIDHLVGPSVLPEAVRSLILRKTEGNPFFIEEVIRGLIAEGTLVKDARDGSWRLARPVAALALPDTIQGVIVARLDRLEEGVKSVLKLAAVIGRSFFLRILQAIAEASNAVDSSLAELEHTELIRVRQQVPELEYIFKHALVQEAAYGSILAERRRAIHRSVAKAIERLFADRLEEFTSLLAYHYALAEDWEKAQAYLFKAGDQAGRMAADAEALEHYRQAEAAYMKVAAQELTPLQRAMLDRKLGQAFYGVGRYDQAVEYFSRALAHLGLRYPQTRGGVRRSTVKFLAAHFLRRLMPGEGRATRPTMDIAVAQEISTICQSLAWLDYFVDEERFGLDSLIELYAGEQSGDVLGRVRGLATLGVVLMMFRAFSLARRRIDEAVAIAQDSNHPAATAMAIFVRGWLQWITGSLDECVHSFEQSIAAYKAIGDIRGWGGPTIYLFWVAYHRADFAAATQLAADLVHVGQDAGDPHVVTWGLNALGALGLTVGRLDEAASHLSTVRDLCIQISAFRMQAGAGGVLGKCRLRQGRLHEAAAILQEAIGLITARNLRGLWSAEPLNAFAELCLIEASRLAGTPRRQALRSASRACVKALRCTRDAVTWLPETLRLHGTLAWLSGDPTSAHKRWQKSLTTAQDLGLVVERARTLLEMGRRLGDAALVDEATGVFAQTDARVDLAFSLHARARMERELGADVRLLLQRYDQAIAALVEVKAEYELGVACRQRAHLHKQLGRLDQAGADLATAQRCFAAVGSAVEQADVEQEAIALAERDASH